MGDSTAETEQLAERAPGAVRVADFTRTILVVRALPDARALRRVWADQIPELVGALVVSPHQGPGAHLGLIAQRVYVNWDADQAPSFRLLARSLGRVLRRAGGDPFLRFLPRCVADPVVNRPVDDVVAGR
jgi:hypothetical protein